MQVKILLLLLGGLALLSPKVTAQSVVPSIMATNGGAATNANFQVAWTLGEPIIQTAGTVTQGFHHPVRQVLSGSESLATANLLQAFPNPVANMLTLQFKDTSIGTATQATVWNALAQPILAVNIPVAAADYQLDCAALLPGIYWLSLRKADGSSVATVRFLKN